MDKQCKKKGKGNSKSGNKYLDWEVWSPDGGMLDSGQVRFQDVCNGGAAHKRKKLRSIPSKYNVLEARWNITTPNGGHSFEKNRQFYERP